MSFWDYQHQTLRAKLSAMVGGFDKDILERFYSLTPDQLARLLNIYSASYGDGPAAMCPQDLSGLETWDCAAEHTNCQSTARQPASGAEF